MRLFHCRFGSRDKLLSVSKKKHTTSPCFVDKSYRKLTNVLASSTDGMEPLSVTSFRIGHVKEHNRGQDTDPLLFSQYPHVIRIILQIKMRYRLNPNTLRRSLFPTSL